MWWFFLGGIITAMGIIAMEKPFHKLALRSVGLLDTLLDPNEGEEKLQRLQTKIFQALSILIIFVLLSFLVMIPTWLLAEVTAEPNLFDIAAPLESHWGMYLIGSILPFVALKFLPKKSDYSSLSQLLHHLILNHYHLGGWMLQKQIKDVPEDVQPRAILITGLARAGTTALTKLIAQSEDVKSLDYSNMPFLLFPRFWKKIYRPSRKENKERAHGDGVRVGLSSVEALEEYCVKTITGDSYISELTLVTHVFDDEQHHLYLKYQASIAEEKVYLAKNNNGLLRLDSLLENPKQQVFIMFRSPLEHANSLMKQHQLFLEKQENDPFVLEYMDWLGHHEFGQNQKSFYWGNEYKYTEAMSINFWLERWVAYYEQVLNFQNHNQVTFISYEAFLKNPELIIKYISDKARINCNTIRPKKFKKVDDTPNIPDSTVSETAQSVYQQLLKATKH